MHHGASNTPRAQQLPCACANLRRAARAVTQLYEEQMRDSGLRATQFTLLQALGTTGAITQGRLGELLSLDSTTLTRTLRPLVKRGWVRSLPGRDRRERHFQLTAAGQRELDRAGALWERAQQRLRKVLGDTAWERLQADLLRVTEAAQSA
ncbi:MAG: MarR family transcriptional regulator [Terriglobia bacterium]|jgi:DNA-binding MarR family transcriptional regulator